MRIRPTARVLVLNSQNQLLLLKYEDALAVQHGQVYLTAYWLTPGGGVEAGETFEQAAVRELWEETGIKCLQLGPLVTQQERLLSFADEDVVFDECFFLLRVLVVEIDLNNSLDYEKELYQGHRWWTIDELEASDELIVPKNLAAIVAPLINSQA